MNCAQHKKSRYHSAFMTLLVMSCINYAPTSHAEEKHPIVFIAQLCGVAALTTICKEGTLLLWNYLTQPPEVEIARITQKEETFNGQQEILIKCQQALEGATGLLDHFAEHMPEEKDDMEQGLRGAGNAFQQAAVRYTTEYLPNYEEYVANL